MNKMQALRLAKRLHKEYDFPKMELTQNGNSYGLYIYHEGINIHIMTEKEGYEVIPAKFKKKVIMEVI